MVDHSICISREWDEDGPEYIVSVIAHRKHNGLPDSVALEARLRNADEVAVWVEEHADAWL
jgi:hypothetical protein